MLSAHYARDVHLVSIAKREITVIVPRNLVNDRPLLISSDHTYYSNAIPKFILPNSYVQHISDVLKLVSNTQLKYSKAPPPNKQNTQHICGMHSKVPLWCSNLNISKLAELSSANSTNSFPTPRTTPLDHFTLHSNCKVWYCVAI